MSVSDYVARRVRQERERRGVTREALADRCTALGWPCTKTVLTNLELGRAVCGPRHPRLVRVDEMVTIAAALDVPVLDFIAGARLPAGARLTADPPDLPRTVTIRLPPGARVTVEE
jgi:transcriptional regulator with XRE-family HTH domain